MQGARYLANALQTNDVRSSANLLVISSSWFPFAKQTLTTLNLQVNRVGDKGAEYLAAALEKNTVK
jgi:hypothetical protein